VTVALEIWTGLFQNLLGEVSLRVLSSECFYDAGCRDEQIPCCVPCLIPRTKPYLCASDYCAELLEWMECVFFFCVLEGGGDPSPCNGSCE
jgi:hypothetical protein